MTTSKVHVGILDDHQSIIDGLAYRLGQTDEIEVVASAIYGDELESMLAKHHIDVMLLDLRVRTSPTNPKPFHVLPVIPQLLQRHPELSILVISMMADPAAIKLIMEAGASGYILKDDQSAFKDLGNVVLSVANGGIYFSKEAYDLYLQAEHNDTVNLLTPRQIEVLSLCDEDPDLTTADLAQKLSVSNSTVRNLLSSAYLRLGVHSRAGAIEKARELGLFIPPEPDSFT